MNALVSFLRNVIFKCLTILYCTLTRSGNHHCLSGYVEGELDNNKSHGEEHLVYCIDNGMTKIYVLKWSEIFDEFSKRHEYLLDKLKLEEELWLRKHNSADEVLADAQNNSAIMEMPLIPKKAIE